MSNLELTLNTNTLQETLSLLATDEDYYVRWGVAQNPNTPQETLSLLATDEDSSVRWEVARNPNTPEEALFLIKSKEYQLSKPLLQLAH